MFIRPDTTSDIAILLLVLFVMLSLYTKHNRRDKDVSLSWFFGVLCNFAFIAFFELLSFSGIASLFSVRLLRNSQVILLFYCIIQFVLTLPPTTDLIKSRKWITPLFLLFLCIELVYMGYRFSVFSQTNLVPLRPLVLQIPIIIPMLLACWINVQKIIFIERSQQYTSSLNKTFLQSFFNPTNQSTRLLRALIILTLASFVLLSLFYSSYWRQTGIWSIVSADILATALIMSSIIITIVYHPANISVETRLLTLILSILLLLIAVLGWVLTYGFLQQNGLISEYVTILGNLLGLIHEPPPPPTQLQKQISTMLVPVALYMIVSTILFVVGFILFYRTGIHHRIQAIILAIGKVESGDLSHQIPEMYQANEIEVIAKAFNTMTASLADSQEKMLGYQSSLEHEVMRQTDALKIEVEKRKTIELKQLLQNERQRIARETHDGALQSLSAISYQLQSADRLINQDKATLEKQLQQLSLETSFAIKEIRHMIHDLNLELLEDGLENAVFTIIEPLQRTFKGHIYCQFNDLDFYLPQDKLVDVVRIIQEALHNAYKHSNANNLWVTATKAENALSITIKDDGNGYDENQITRGYGLNNMRSRARRLGTNLTITSQLGEGSSIQFLIPK